MKLLTAASILSLYLIGSIVAEPLAETKKPARRAKSFSSSSSSTTAELTTSDSCGGCGQCAKTYITKMDFYHVYPILSGASQNWEVFNDGLLAGFEANDGEFTYGCHGGVVDSQVFSSANVALWPNPAYENFKYLILAEADAAVPKNGDLVVEFEGSAEVFKANENPFPAPLIQNDDLRLGYGLFTSMDRTTGLTISWILTNDRAYVVYSRIVTASRTVLNNYSAFTFVVPVKMREACDVHNMKLIWHGATKQVSWRIDGREVFRVVKVGYHLDRQYMVVDLAGQEAPAFPDSVTYGFGTGDMLNAYPACKRSDVCCECGYPTLRQALLITGSLAAPPQYNPLLGFPTTAVFWKDDIPIDVNDYIWGQGAVVKIEKLLVYQDYCATRKC